MVLTPLAALVQRPLNFFFLFEMEWKKSFYIMKSRQYYILKGLTFCMVNFLSFEAYCDRLLLACV